MTRFLLFFLVLLCSVGWAAPTVKPTEPVVSFDLDSMSLSQVMRVVYLEAYKERPYFLNPNVINDQRLVSFRYAPKDGDFRAFLATFLADLGYKLERKEGADFVLPLPPSEKPSIAENPNMEIFYYRTKYRSGSYLVEVLSPVFKGKFTSQRVVSAPSNSTAGSPAGGTAPEGSALEKMERDFDQLLFAGSPHEVKVLKQLLSQVDTSTGEVLVSGLVYEVQTGEHRGSALSLAGSLLSGKLKLGLGTAQAADNFVSLQLADMTTIMQALDSDSRFKVLSSPQVRVLSGRSATFTVGDKVPTIGAITYPQGGSAPVQSVDYKSSGVIFTIQPQVHGEAIDVQVDQQVSSFVETKTGVNNSPTLTSRQISTSVSMADGDVVVIGGLRQGKDSMSSSGWSLLPSWFSGKSDDRNNTEILLFLKLRRL